MGKLTDTHCLSNVAFTVHSKYMNTYFKFYTIPVMTFQSRFYAPFREWEPEACSLLNVAHCSSALVLVAQHLTETIPGDFAVQW